MPRKTAITINTIDRPDFPNPGRLFIPGFITPQIRMASQAVKKSGWESRRQLGPRARILMAIKSAKKWSDTQEVPDHLNEFLLANGRNDR
jgi:hypothetical protein